MAEIIRIRTKSGKYYRGGKEYRNVGELCPACGSTDRIKEKGKLVERKNKTNGNLFLGCSRYPECKSTYPLANSEETTIPDFENAKPKPDCLLCKGSGIDNYSFDEPSDCTCKNAGRDLSGAKPNCSLCCGSGVYDSLPCYCVFEGNDSYLPE